MRYELAALHKRRTYTKASRSFSTDLISPVHDRPICGKIHGIEVFYNRQHRQDHKGKNYQLCNKSMQDK